LHLERWACWLAATTVPASSVMRAALGERGAALMHRIYFDARFLAQGCSPRPGFTSPWLKTPLFPQRVLVSPRTRVRLSPSTARLVSRAHRAFGRYEQILIIVSVDSFSSA